MRTTLDIDDDILAAAKERAAAEKKTAGKVLSELARAGINGSLAEEVEWENGLPLIPRGGNVVTSELVNRLIDELE